MATIQWGSPNWGRKRDFQPLSGFGINDCWIVECCQHSDGSVIGYSTKQRRLLIAGDSAAHQSILLRQESSTLRRRCNSKSEAELTTIKDCARNIVLLKLTTDRHKALHGLSATAECDLSVCRHL